MKKHLSSKCLFLLRGLVVKRLLLAVVVQVHPKRLEFSCGGCHMSVPLELVNALKSREDIQCCNVCGRILYVQEEAATTG